MAKITATCELMDNAFPAGPLKLRGNFFAVQDPQGECIIFSVDDFGSLCLIVKGQDGHNELVKLGTKFSLTDAEPVTALAVSQNQEDRNVNLVFAACQKDGSSRLYVVEPTAPTREAWSAESLVDKVYSGNADWKINVRDIMLAGSSEDSGVYPQIHLVFNHLHLSTEDIFAISVSRNSRTWAHEPTFQLPCNPLDVLDKCPAAAGDYRGLYVLFKQRSSTQLRFVGYDRTETQPTIISVPQPAPEGATRLAGLVNKEGMVDLLVSGKSLTFRRAVDFHGGKTTPFHVVSDSAVVKLSQLQVAQVGDVFSAWSLGHDKLLSYQEFALSETGTPSPTTPSIPLLDQVGNGGRFATTRSPTFGQKVFVADDVGTVKMLEQNRETCIWQPAVDVMIPDSERVIQFSSYTIHVSVADDQGVPMRRAALRVASSATVELLVNGKTVRGSAEGETVETDDEGFLTVIIRNEGLSAPTITLQNAASGPNLFSQKKVIDPMSKVWDTIDGVSSAKDLSDMTLPDGKKFVREGVSEEELEVAAKALQGLSKARKELAEDDAVKPTPAPSQDSQMSVLSQSSQSGGLWGALHFLFTKIKEGWNCFVEKIKEGWRFVVELGKKVWNFIIETAQHVAAAIQAVLEAISEGWEWIKQKLGFLFSWGDIVAVKNVIVNVTTQGILLAADSVTTLENNVQGFFDDTRAKIRQLKQADLPSDILGINLGVNGRKSRKSEALDLFEQIQSPQGQFGVYHMKHSGGTLGPRQPGESVFARLWKRLQGIWDEAKTLFERLGMNIVKLLLSDDVTLGDVIKTVGFDLLDDFLGVVSSVVTAILGSLSDLLLELVDKINEKINIPVISPLYKAITGSDLSLLDAVCLVMAIPATLVYKFVTGSSPKDIEGIEPYTRPGKLEQELDKRMGRLRSETQAVPETKGSDMGTMGVLNVRSRGMQPNRPSSKAIRQQGAFNNLVNFPQQSDSDNSDSQKDFVLAHATTNDIIQVVSAVGGVLWYNFVTFPSIFRPEGSSLWGFVSAAGKGVLWFGQFAKLSDWDLSADNNIIGHKLQTDSTFVPRFASWCVGGIATFPRAVSKYVDNVCGLISAGGQVAILVWTMVETVEVKGSYPVALAFEEWLRVLGKLATHAAGLESGGDPYTLGAAYGLTFVGNIFLLGRTKAELQGSKPELSGVDDP